MIWQDALTAFKAQTVKGAPVEEMTLTQWLKPSFWALPGDQYRQMFLDAATLMRGEPLAHLRAAWVAHVQLDSGLREGPAEFSVTSMLVELLDSSLITISTAAAGEHSPRWAL